MVFIAQYLAVRLYNSSSHSTWLSDYIMYTCREWSSSHSTWLSDYIMYTCREWSSSHSTWLSDYIIYTCGEWSSSHSTWLSDYIIYTCREWSSSHAARQSWLVCSRLPCWCPLRVSVTDQLQQSSVQLPSLLVSTPCFGH